MPRTKVSYMFYLVVLSFALSGQRAMAEDPASSIDNPRQREERLAVNKKVLSLSWINIDPLESHPKQSAIYFLETEISFRQFAAVCPESFKAISKLKENRSFKLEWPVRSVSVKEIEEFLSIINDAQKRRSVSEDKYRLPTLAEWQHAARAGREDHEHLIKWDEFRDQIKLQIVRKSFNRLTGNLKRPISDEGKQKDSHKVKYNKSYEIPFPEDIKIVDSEGNPRAWYGKIDHEDSGVYYYTPQKDFIGDDFVTFRYQIKDRFGRLVDNWIGTEVFAVEVVSGSIETRVCTPGESIEIKLVGFFGKPGSVKTTKEPKNGKVALAHEPGEPPVFTYEPDAGFFGDDEFTYVQETTDEPKSMTIRVKVTNEFINKQAGTCKENGESIIDVLGFSSESTSAVELERRLDECKFELLSSTTKEGGNVEAVDVILYAPEEGKKNRNTIVEFKYEAANSEKGALLIEIGNVTLEKKDCLPGEFVNIYRGNAEPVFLDSERLSVENVGDEKHPNYHLYFQAKRGDVGLQKVTYVQKGVRNQNDQTTVSYVYVTEKGSPPSKRFDASNNESIILKADETAMLSDEYPRIDPVKPQTGKIWRIPAVRYIPKKDTYLEHERFDVDLVHAATGRRESFGVYLKVSTSSSGQLALKCLNYWGALSMLRKINDFNGGLTDRTTPSAWIKRAREFSGTQDQIIQEVCVPLLKTKGKKKMAEAIFLDVLRPVLQADEKSQYPLRYSIYNTQGGKDRNEWGLRNMHGNAPEIVRSKDGQPLLKGYAGIIRNNPTFFLISHEGEAIGREAETDEQVQNRRAGFRLVKESRLSEYWFEALREAANNSDRSAREITDDLEIKACVVQDLAKIETDTSRKKGTDAVGEIAALYQAVAHVRADEPVPANVAEKVVYLGKKMDDPFFEYLGNVMKHRN